jgi:hypothetical protein
MLRAPSTKSLPSAAPALPPLRSSPSLEAARARRLRSPGGSAPRFGALTERLGLAEVLAGLVGILLLASWAFIVTHPDALRTSSPRDLRRPADAAIPDLRAAATDAFGLEADGAGGGERGGGGAVRGRDVGGQAGERAAQHGPRRLLRFDSRSGAAGRCNTAQAAPRRRCSPAPGCLIAAGARR